MWRVAWCSLPIGAALGCEIFQMVGWAPGTFDWVDVLMCVGGAVFGYGVARS